MPHNFDSEDEEHQQQFASAEFEEDGGIDVGEGTEEFVANITKESADTVYMSEAERRLDIASYYRQLLRGSIFESEDDGARQVESELRAFAEGRLQILLGIRPDDRPVAIVKPQFTDDEATALRKFASMSEAEQRVLWALLATAARSKSVVGAQPVKTQPQPVRVVPVQTPVKRPPIIRKIGTAVDVEKTAPAPALQRPVVAKPAPKTRQPVQRPGGPPAPLRMPRGQEMEGILAQTAISQSRQGAKMDEARRRDQGGEVFRG